LNVETLRNAPRELRTGRLIMQAPCIEHAQAIADLFNASLPHWRFIHWPKHSRDLAWAEAFCARGLKYVDDGENLIFNVFEAPGESAMPGSCIGRIDLHSFDFDTPRCEIGYVADPRIEGRGLMREATLAVADLGFSLGLARIEALSDVAADVNPPLFAGEVAVLQAGMDLG
jgi:RimJ/RimL family protein N-acetyltransferase